MTVVSESDDLEIDETEAPFDYNAAVVEKRAAEKAAKWAALRPNPTSIAAYCMLAVGCLYLMFLYRKWSTGPGDAQIDQLRQVMLLGVRVFFIGGCFVGAYAVLGHKKWGRILLGIVAGKMMLNLGFHSLETGFGTGNLIAIGFFCAVLWALFRPGAKAWFETEAAE